MAKQVGNFSANKDVVGKIKRELRTITAAHPLVSDALEDEFVLRSLDGIDCNGSLAVSRLSTDRFADAVEDYFGYHGEHLHFMRSMDGWRDDVQSIVQKALEKLR